MPEPQPVECHLPQGRRLPLIFDSPHSGEENPPDFRPAVSFEALLHGADRYVDRLFHGAPAAGGTLVAARFPRTYIDPNRSLLDIDPELLDRPWPEESRRRPCVAQGTALVWRNIASGQPIYDRLLSLEEVRHRIETYWQVYHDTVQRALDDAHARHGVVWHLNCHSMRSVGDSRSPDPARNRPDFILGDLDRRACDPAYTGFVARVLREEGHRVTINDHYKGAELVERHGRPEAGRHSLQIEINRGLYMDEATLEPSPGFDRLRSVLDRLCLRLAEFVEERLVTRGA